MNSIVISGRFTKDMELRKTKDGTSFLTNTVAVDGYSKGEKFADFFTVNFWGKNAERVAQYGGKGMDNLGGHSRPNRNDYEQEN